MAFKTKKLGRPVTEKAEEEGYDEEQDYDDEEEIEESEEQQIKKAVNQEEPKRPKQEVSEEKITINDVLINHEDRIKSIEATLFRLSRI